MKIHIPKSYRFLITSIFMVSMMLTLFGFAIQPEQNKTSDEKEIILLIQEYDKSSFVPINPHNTVDSELIKKIEVLRQRRFKERKDSLDKLLKKDPKLVLKLSDSIRYTKKLMDSLENKKITNPKAASSNETVKKSLYDKLDNYEGIIEFQFHGSSYRAFVTSLGKENQVNLYLKNKSGKNYFTIPALIKEFNDSLDFLMVMNGGMYLPDGEPQGILIQNGIEKKKIDTIDAKNNTNFYMMPNGVFFIDSSENAFIKRTEDYPKGNKYVKNATQSGPMLVINEKLNPKFMEGSKNKNIRNGVGVINKNHIVFIISDNEVNFWDFATVFKDIFGCKNALYLDGAISKMYIKNGPAESEDSHFGPIISVTKIKKK